MKKILLLIIPIIITSCAFQPNPEDFFINEDFVLLNKYEKDKVINGQTRTIKTWEIIRIEMDEDSVYIGIIDNTDVYTSGCASSDNTIITDELWKSRKIGSILHFDYINKDRFHKRPRKDYTAVATSDAAVYSDTESIKYNNEGSLTVTTTEPTELKTVDATIINMNDLEIERRILEIEREIMSLERELETLKNQIE